MWNSACSVHNNYNPLFVYIKRKKEVKESYCWRYAYEKYKRYCAILLFAILLQLCSSGMELLTLGVGVVGLIISIIDDAKK